MSSEPPPLPPPPPPRQPLALPLVLAFVPSVLALLVITLSPSKSHLAAACVPAAVVSVACCAVSSIMLFKRNTTATLVFGVLLAMLNMLIPLSMGCAALIADANSH